MERQFENRPQGKIYKQYMACIERQACHKCLEAYSAFEGYVTEGTNPAEPAADIISGERKVTIDPTEVLDLLRSKGIVQVVITGVATEYWYVS